MAANWDRNTTSWDVIKYTPNLTMKGKVVLITGPTEGIGKSTADAIAVSEIHYLSAIAIPS